MGVNTIVTLYVVILWILYLHQLTKFKNLKYDSLKKLTTHVQTMQTACYAKNVWITCM